MEVSDMSLQAAAATWRPFAARNLIVRSVSRRDEISFVIDPWTQRWAILIPGAEAVLGLADGHTCLSAIVDEVVRTTSDPRLRDPTTVAELAWELRRQRLLYDSETEHQRAGTPVYNASDLIGLHLEVTNACNLACRHCYVSSGEKLPDELSDEELRAIIDQLPPFAGKRIALSGGEALVRKGCLDLAEYCLSRGHHVDLYTNGYKFPRKFADRIVGFGDIYPARMTLQVSLEGADAPTNDLIRGRGAFEQTIASLRMFREVGLSRQTRIFVCATKLNIDQVDALITLCEDLDVAQLFFSQWQRQGNASDVPWESIAPTTEEWVQAGERLLDYDNPRLAVGGNFYGDLHNAADGRFTLDQALFPKHVYFYNSVPRVAPDGMIFADQLWTDEAWALGNIRDMTLEEAFQSERFHSQLAQMRQRLSKVADCQGCEWRDLCECGSPGHVYAEYGDLNHRDLFCAPRIEWFERYIDAQVDALV